MNGRADAPPACLLREDWGLDAEVTARGEKGVDEGSHGITRSYYGAGGGVHDEVKGTIAVALFEVSKAASTVGTGFVGQHMEAWCWKCGLSIDHRL
jgi:hypothetical protein